MLRIDFLNSLRQAELDLVVGELPAPATILEFGAGTGIQARELANRGYRVKAIDLPASGYSDARVYDVQDYDGRSIPLPDASVDVVFSSNVLEHVEDLPTTFAEFRRILAPGGYCVHLMPSVSWRAWTFAAGIPESVAAMFRLLAWTVRPPAGTSRAAAARRNLKTALGSLLPIGHGTSFEGISELWTFSSAAWKREFERNGFTVERCRPVGIFHTGHMLLGPSIPIASRQSLSSLFGSAATVYVVRPSESARSEH